LTFESLWWPIGSQIEVLKIAFQSNSLLVHYIFVCNYWGNPSETCNLVIIRENPIGRTCFPWYMYQVSRENSGPMENLTSHGTKHKSMGKKYFYMTINFPYMGIYQVIKNHSIVYLREMLSFGNTRRSSKKNTEENIQYMYM
jgi:hypothetical protein